MRALARLAAGHVHRVVFDPRTETRLAKHLQILFDAHADALGLDEAVVFLEERDPLLEFGADGGRGGLHAAGSRHVLIGRVEVELLQLLAGFDADGVEFADGLEGVAPEFEPDGGFHVGRPDIDCLAAGSEVAAFQDCVVAGVLVGDQFRQQFISAHRHSGFE